MRRCCPWWGLNTRKCSGLHRARSRKSITCLLNLNANPFGRSSSQEFILEGREFQIPSGDKVWKEKEERQWGMGSYLPRGGKKVPLSGWEGVSTVSSTLSSAWCYVLDNNSPFGLCLLAAGSLGLNYQGGSEKVAPTVLPKAEERMTTLCILLGEVTVMTRDSAPLMMLIIVVYSCV